MSSIDRLIDRVEGLVNKTRTQLAQNAGVSRQVHELQAEIVRRDEQIDQMLTRHENLQIFMQHLASLNLRNNFLDKQVTTLELQAQARAAISATNNLGLKQFREWKETELDWKTAETTYENLCMEYEYLRKQLGAADEEMESSFEESPDSSLFSDNTGEITDEVLSSPTPPPARHRLMKMESFLSIPVEQQSIAPPKLPKTALKQFRISSREQKETEEIASEYVPYKVTDLPILEEEDEEDELEDTMIPLRHHISLPDKEGFQNKETIQSPVVSTDISWYFNETPPRQKKLRHFASHDTGLSNRARQLNLKGFRLVSEQPDEPVATAGAADMTVLSSSSKSVKTVKHSCMDADDTVSIVSEDYDDGEVEPIYEAGTASYDDLDLAMALERKPSRAHSLHRSHSHESIFDGFAEHRDGLSAELKQQTLRWLKPSVAVVSASDAVTEREVAKGQKPRSISSSFRELQQELKAPEPVEIPPATPSSFANWWNNLIPDTAMVTSETGKLIDTPAARSLVDSSRKGVQRRVRFGPVTISHPQGAYTAVLMEPNGNVLVRHSLGCDDVISSRISHAALRDALHGSIQASFV